MSTSNLKLLEPASLGDLELKNRIALSPMTRSRAPESVPTDLMAKYYKQRSSGGLLITEATQIAADGIGYPWTPGIYTDEQTEGWKKVVDAVHEDGAYIFNQIFHEGRIAHPHFLNGDKPIAPSAVKPKGQTFTGEGMKDLVEPREMGIDDIERVIAAFKLSAENAKKAGFDGIEIHGANGYIIDQFLQDGTNKRTDEYGGNIENRARFLFEVLEETISIWGENKVGLRLSPSGLLNDMSDSHPTEHFKYVIEKLNDYPLAYLHLVEPLIPVDKLPKYSKNVAADFRAFYNGFVIANGGYTRETGEEALQAGNADMIAYGKPFLANPDLPKRFELGVDLNKADESTFYGGDEKGYTDYPTMKEAVV
ncbi:MAG: alkene reductase [Bacteroidota bacterium]